MALIFCCNSTDGVQVHPDTTICPYCLKTVEHMYHEGKDFSHG